MIRTNRNQWLTPRVQSTLMSYAARMGLQYTKNTARMIYNAWKSNKSGSSRSRQVRVSKPEFKGGAPVAYSSRQRPRIGQGRKHVVTASELLGDVNGSVLFECKKYTINPGLSETFPRLSKEAAVWQHYRFTRLRFRYVTRSGTADPGSVIISPSYNPAEPAPADEKEASNTQDSIEDVTWSKLIVCDLKPSSMFSIANRKQVRYFNIPGDYNVYDAANLYVCTKGQTGAGLIGKLWVDYTVEFYVPQSTPTNPEFREMSDFAPIYLGVTPPNPVYTSLLTNPFFDGHNPLDVTLAAQNITFPRGVYLIMIDATFTVEFSATQEIGLDLAFYEGGGIIKDIIGPLVPPGGRISMSNQHAFVVTDPTQVYTLRYAVVGAGVNGITNAAISFRVLNV